MKNTEHLLIFGYYYVHDFREETDPEEAALTRFCQKLVFWASLHFVDPLKENVIAQRSLFHCSGDQMEFSVKPNLMINLVSDVSFFLKGNKSYLYSLFNSEHSLRSRFFYYRMRNAQ